MKSKVLAAPAVAGALLAALTLPAMSAAPSFEPGALNGKFQNPAAGAAAFAAADYAPRRRTTSRSPAAATTRAKSKPATKYPGYYGPVGGPARKPAPVIFGIGGSW